MNTITEQFQKCALPNIQFFVAAIALGFFVVGCSSDSDPTFTVLEPTEAPTVNPPAAFSGSLTQKSNYIVVNYLRNGLYSASVGEAEPEPNDNQAPIDFASSDSGFSTTNTQESGVDEADRIEFDGTTMYVADYPIWTSELEYQASIRVLSKQSDNSLTEVSRLPILEPEWAIHGMYLASETSDKRLAVLSGSQPVYPVDNLSTTLALPNNVDNDFVIEVYNVNQPMSIGTAETIRVDGRLLSSRRIDNMLYVVSAYVPQVEGIEFAAIDEATRLENYKKILDFPISELIPSIYFNGQRQNVLSVDDCYIPEQATSQDGYAQIVQILSIDLTTPNNMQGTCMAAVTSFTYTSSDALYLAGNAENTTYLHKISLGDQVEYQASGTVPGIVGWNGQSQLRLSEWQQTLRIVTTDYQRDPDVPFHRLFSLQQQGNDLNIVGELPNETHPDPIGKPGEDVYAVRYVADKGYVVTFERIDPLYVIGLGDPTNPVMLGELEIPGVSSYLQPFGDGLLLGIGQQINFQQIPNNGQVAIMPIPVQSMKISLFDVRDPANPAELSTLLRENTYTPTEFDYRTLSILNEGDKTRFAMPIESWGSTDDFLAAVGNSLLVFDVDASTEPSLTEVIQLTAESIAPYYIYSGEDRSILTNDGVYYLRANDLWFHSSIIGDELNGPY